MRGLRRGEVPDLPRVVPRQAHADEPGVGEHARDPVAGEAHAVRIHPAVRADARRRRRGRGVDEGACDQPARRERAAEVAQAAHREFAQVCEKIDCATMKSKSVANTSQRKSALPSKRGCLIRTMSAPTWFAIASSTSHRFGSMPW